MHHQPLHPRPRPDHKWAHHANLKDRQAQRFEFGFGRYMSMGLLVFALIAFFAKAQTLWAVSVPLG